MNQEKMLKQLVTDVAELKAMVAQLGPVNVEPPIQQEIDALLAQGVNIGDYYYAKGKRRK